MSDLNNGRKRNAIIDAQGDTKRNKSNKGKYFKASKGGTLTGIETGTQGIFATCDRNKEAKCVMELYDLFQKYAELFYPEVKEQAEKMSSNARDDGNEDDEDIESMMARELAQMKDTGRGPSKNKDDDKKAKLFTSVKLDTQCVVFFQTNVPIKPAEFVRLICENALDTGIKQCRFTHRLTPIEQITKATMENLLEIAPKVLEPWFHNGQKGVKFAIRPTIRDHNVLGRMDIINTVAKCVGPDHQVDLKNYDVLVLVEVYRNILGISVVKDFQKLKTFNLAQIQQESQGTKQPEPKPTMRTDIGNAPPNSLTLPSSATEVGARTPTTAGDLTTAVPIEDSSAISSTDITQDAR